MDRNLSHYIFRCYIALARGEYFEPIDAPETRGLIDHLEIPPTSVKRVWYENDKLVSEICEAQGITRERFFQSGAFEKPSRIANLIYCSRLRTVADLTNVRGFKNGLLELPKGQGMFIPIRENGEITELRFYRLGRLLKKRQTA